MAAPEQPPKEQFKNYITPRGFKRLRDEFLILKLVQRPQLIEEIAAAAAMGDRSENAEYIYGKRRMREIDRRLRFLHKRMAAAEIVEPSTDRGQVIYFGATVLVAYPDGTEKTLELVGEDEIEADLGRITWRSPMGVSMMRKREGDTVRFTHLGERVDVEILEVTYKPQIPDPPSRWDLHMAAFRASGKTPPPEVEAVTDEDLGDETDEEASS